jgi:CBS-domain-containing membrane protein
MANTLRTIAALLGLGGNKTSHTEKLVAGAGGFTGILLTLLVTRAFVGLTDGALIVASMGASAVLVFAVPHGQLSQPWALMGGHLLSAVIGVSCYLLIPEPVTAAACAVGLAITAMYYLQCVHPPGGATALSAVIAGPGVHELGFQYVLTPVMLNALIILSVAVAFNYLFPWRRYPAALTQYTRRCKGAAPRGPAAKEPLLSNEDLDYALQRMDMYVDIGEDDLRRIYNLARHRTRSTMGPQDIRLGHYYSNGEYGEGWSVRRVIDESGTPGADRDQIIYRVVAGQDRRNTGAQSRADFSRWARYEVVLNENSWQRVDSAEVHPDSAAS